MYAAEMGNVDCINALCEAEAEVNCEVYMIIIIASLSFFFFL